MKASEEQTQETLFQLNVYLCGNIKWSLTVSDLNEN